MLSGEEIHDIIASLPQWTSGYTYICQKLISLYLENKQDPFYL